VHKEPCIRWGSIHWGGTDTAPPFGNGHSPGHIPHRHFLDTRVRRDANANAAWMHANQLADDINNNQQATARGITGWATARLCLASSSLVGGSSDASYRCRYCSNYVLLLCVSVSVCLLHRTVELRLLITVPLILTAYDLTTAPFRHDLAC